MNVRKKLHPLAFQGLFLLVIANLSTRIPTSTTFSQDLKDALTGLLFGLAIGCMLLGIWKSRKGPDGPATHDTETR